jgi:hypothetical protein
MIYSTERKSAAKGTAMSRRRGHGGATRHPAAAMGYVRVSVRHEAH